MDQTTSDQLSRKGDGLASSTKALIAQFTGWVLAFLLLWAGLLATPWQLVLCQCFTAALTARVIRSDHWWLPMHLVFAPALLAVHRLGVAPGWYLAAFIAMALVFWTTYRTRVPLYLSGRMTCDALISLLPPDRPARVLDIGSGTGSLLSALADKRPDCWFTGIETAPAPWLLSWLQARRKSNLAFQRGDFFRTQWSGYDVIYAFLSPEPMEAVGRKAAREMSAGSMLISNSFPVPSCPPSEVIEIPDRGRTRLFVYRAADLIKTGK